MKRVVIVGATSGIGHEVALQLIRCGCRIGVAGRREAALQALKASMPGQVVYRKIDITAEDEVYAFSQAQAILEEQASQDETLLLQAQQRAQTLLENYIKNLGEAVGKQYTIQWVYLDAEGNPVRSNNSTTADSAESGAK